MLAHVLYAPQIVQHAHQHNNAQIAHLVII